MGVVRPRNKDKEPNLKKCVKNKQTNKADRNKYDRIASECSGVGLSCEMQELHLKISSRIKRNGRRIGKRTRALCPVFLDIFLKLEYVLSNVHEK